MEARGPYHVRPLRSASDREAETGNLLERRRLLREELAFVEMLLEAGGEAPRTDPE